MSEVPYHSQWATPEGGLAVIERGADPCDDPRWREAGFEDEAAYRFWSWRVCGLACLQSVLAHWRGGAPSLRVLRDGALVAGAYRVRADGSGIDGLIYAPFAAWVARDFGLHVTVHPRWTLNELVANVSERSMVIASVSPAIRDVRVTPAERGGHLVLVHGHDAGGLWLHNPSGGSGTQADVHVACGDFERFFAGRGMVIGRDA